MTALEDREAARRLHYRDLYDPSPTPSDLPTLVVVGNCQAESLRLLLAETGPDPDVRAVRVPAVHELGPADVEPFHALVRRTDLLVSQPVSADHRGLPIGTAQLVDLLPPGARHVLVPSTRWTGLHPYHSLVHPPGIDDPDPPVVPYHDARTLVAAAWRRAGRTAPPVPELTPQAVRAIADDSLAELRRRELAHGTVQVTDQLEQPRADDFRTLNHPGNRLMGVVVARARAALGLAERPPTLTRPLLNGIHAPLEPAVVAAHGLDVEPRPDWDVVGTAITEAEVREAHLHWLESRDDVLDLALTRAARVLEHLGLALPVRSLVTSPPRGASEP